MFADTILPPCQLRAYITRTGIKNKSIYCAAVLPGGEIVELGNAVKVFQPPAGHNIPGYSLIQIFCTQLLHHRHHFPVAFAVDIV